MDINYIAPINSLGYGICGLNILKALSKEHKVSLWMISGTGEAPPEDHELIRKCAEDNPKFFNPSAPCLRLWHQNDMAQMVGKGLHTGYPIFELNRFTKQEEHHLHSLDHIFVASDWAKKVLRDNGINWVTVAPLGVDTSIFKPIEGEPYQETRFLNIGKWEVRKGHDILVEAFNKAFEPSDNVRLIMNCHNPFLREGMSITNEKWEQEYLSSKMGSKITILKDRLPTQLDVANVMNQVDCGVFPARAEGWNLELLEMMACGKQVITTNYSGHTEFTTPLNSHLIQIKSLETAYDGLWFRGQGEWASLGDDEIDQLVQHMRKIHKMKQSGFDLYNSSGVATAQEYSWNATAEKIVGVLSNETNRNSGTGT